MSQRLRIFISSPSDVRASREIAALTIERLAQDYARFFQIEPYLWEYEAMIASGHFQDSIELPSAFDVVVLILWSRLGTLLPEKTSTREYRGIDGRSPLTGTEWEFEDALAGAQKHGAPDLLVYRSVKPASFNVQDAGRRNDELRQFNALEHFWERHFVNRGVFLGAYTSFSSDAEFVKLLETHLRSVIERRIGLLSKATGSAAKTWLQAPFRGLEAYEFEHAPVYFGQDAPLSNAMLQLSDNAEAGGAFLLVLGASGSGKSSLVKAGIAPKLFVPRRIPGVSFLRRVVFTPSDAREGEDIFDALARRLTTQVSPLEGVSELIGPGQTAASLAAHLRHAVDAPAYPIGTALGHLADQARLAGRMLDYESGKLLLIVDQLEELFTNERWRTHERRRFIALLAGFVHSKLVWVVATMRRDFWHSAEETPQLLTLADGSGRLELQPPSATQQSQMIQRPAVAAGVEFERHRTTGVPLNEVIAEELAREPGALPLMSYLLDQLYRRDVVEAGGNTLTYDRYEQLGRLDGAIATQAEAVLARCAAEDRAALGSVLFSLVQVSSSDGDSERAVARRVPLSAFPVGTAQRRLVDMLLDPDARLLVSDADQGSAPTIRVAHESLISRWSIARDFLKSNAAALKIRRRLEERYTLWLAHRDDAASKRRFGTWQTPRGREPGLLTDIDLADGRRLLREHPADTDPPLAAFIERSIADDRRLRSRSVRVLAVVAAVVTVLAVAASVAGWIATQKQHEAEAQREQTLLAQSRLLTESAAQRLKANDVASAQGIILEVLARRGASPVDRAAAISVFQEARAADYQIAAMAGHDDEVVSAVFSPDGTRILSASRDRTARVWDARTGVALATYGEGRIGVTAAYSPDGARFVSPSPDKIVRIWDAATGRQLMELSGHTANVRSAVFSPDGAYVVTSAYDKTARIWDARTGAQLKVLIGHTDRVQNANFSPDGSRIVTAAFDNTARVWDSRSGAQLGEPLKHNGPVMSAAYSADGSRLVTACADNSATVWDARSLTRIAELTGHSDRVLSASFAPDGSRVLTSSADNTARIWDPSTGTPIAVLSGHTDRVSAAAYSPDGKTIVTGSHDRTVRVWDAGTLNPIAVLKGHGLRVITAEYSPDGDRIITASYDKTARIWDSRSGALLGALSGEDEIIGAAYSKDGARILIATKANAIMWNTASQARIGALDNPGDGINSAVYSPDGTRIVTASRDKKARIWDAATRQLLTILAGHTDAVTYAVFSPDGRRVLTASYDKTARVWDAIEGKELAVLSGHLGHVELAEFSADGARIATASADKTVRIWDARTAALLTVLYGHEDYVNTARFSQDGARIVTGSDDKSARIWDARSGAQLAVLAGHSGEVEWAAYSPDAKRIVTASGDKTARIWDASVPANLDAQIEWQTAAVVDPLPDEQRIHLGLPSAARFRSNHPSDCDREAAAIYDPDRLASGVLTASIAADAARTACTRAVAETDQSPRALYQLGRALAAGHDAQGARTLFERAVKGGYRAARVDLALLLADKSAGTADLNEAASLFEQAWTNGVAIAAFELGQLYEHGAESRAAQAWVWYQKGADAGEPNALARLAEREETAMLAEHSLPLQDSRLMRAFIYYATAAETALDAGWPDESWTGWRLRRATLARTLARDGMMQQVADAYAAIHHR